MKKINNFKLKISMLVLLVIIMVVQVGPFLVYADESVLTFTCKNIDMPCTNDYYDGHRLLFTRATIGGHTAYCLDHGIPTPYPAGQSGQVKYLRELSPVTTTVIKNGYPNMTPGQLGVKTAEEAEFATQIAVWGTVHSTTFKDSYKSPYIIDIANLVAKPGKEEYMKRVNAAARRMITAAAADPYYSNPKFLINSLDRKMVIKDDNMIVGPYKIYAKGFEVTSATVGLKNAPASAKITDAQGNELTSFKNNDIFYVTMSKSEKGSELIITGSVSGNVTKGKVYGTGNMKDNKQDFAIVTTEPVKLTDESKLKWSTLAGNVKIIKIDQYNNVVAGAKFEVRDMNDKVIVSGTTNEQGLLEFENLPVGKYKLVEVEAPKGYILYTKPFEFEVKHGETREIKFQNRKQEPGKIIIEKIDQNNNPVPGCKFKLNDEKGNLIYEGTSDKDGLLTFENLKEGKYFLQEISAPDGYAIARKPFPINVTNHKVVKVKFPNKRINGGMKIIKVDENDVPLEGVKFEILDANKNLIETIVTDKNGIAMTKKHYMPGKYHYREIEAPNNIIIDKNTYEFVIDNFDDFVIKNIENKVKKGKLIINKVDENKKPLTGVKFEILDSYKKVVDTVVTNEKGEAVTKELAKGKYFYREVEVPEGIRIDKKEYPFEMDYQDVIKQVVNQFEKGTLKILKIDDNEIPLKGIKFEIYDENKKLVDTIVTDEKGVAMSKELTLGTYYYKEVEAPDTVIMDTEMHKFVISKDGEVVIKNIVNKLAKGKLRIIKTTETNVPISNVKFQILDEAKEVIETIVTDEKGIAETKPLKAGKYYYREVEAPVSVIPDYTEYDFKIESNDQVIEKKVINEFVKGSLKIVKVDDLNAPVANVKFEILNKNKEVIQTIVTDEKGIAVSEKLQIGKYYYREVEAPDNLIMDKKLHEFKLTENNQVIEDKVTNKRLEGKLIIYKKDKNTKKPIEGVTFQILNEKKEVIETVKTDKDGIARVGGLVKGKYFIKEVEAPDEYIMNTVEHDFEISKDVQTVERTIYNAHKELPKTGGFISTNLLIVIIVAVVVIAGFLIIKFVIKK